MQTLQPNETILTGSWLEKDGSLVADDVCHRIKWLIKEQLEFVAKDLSGWETLYRDRSDERFWEHSYPHSDWHGGGPPQLKVISSEAEILKYGINVI